MENLKEIILEEMSDNFYANVCTKEDNFISTIKRIYREYDYRDAMGMCLDYYSEVLECCLYMKDVEYIYWKLNQSHMDNGAFLYEINEMEAGITKWYVEDATQYKIDTLEWVIGLIEQKSSDANLVEVLVNLGLRDYDFKEYTFDEDSESYDEEESELLKKEIEEMIELLKKES